MLNQIYAIFLYYVAVPTLHLQMDTRNQAMVLHILITGTEKKNKKK